MTKRGPKTKYPGKLRSNGLAIRLTPFAYRERHQAMAARGLASFYDLVEELIREDLARVGTVETEAERLERER